MSWGRSLAVQLRYSSLGTDSARLPDRRSRNARYVSMSSGCWPGTTYHTQVVAWSQRGDSVVQLGPDVTTDTLPSRSPQTGRTGDPSKRHPDSQLCGFDNPNSLTRGFAFVVDSRWADSLVSFGVTASSQISPRNSTSAYTPFCGTARTAAFNTLGYLAAEYHEVDAAGNLLRKWTATGGYNTDNHEILLTTRGTAVLMGFDFRTMDLSAAGGAPNAQVLGNVLQEVDSLGRVVFLGTHLTNCRSRI